MAWEDEGWVGYCLGCGEVVDAPVCETCSVRLGLDYLYWKWQQLTPSEFREEYVRDFSD